MKLGRLLVVVGLAWGCGSREVSRIGEDAPPLAEDAPLGVADAPPDALGPDAAPATVTYLKPAITSNYRQWFGDSVAISADGSTLAIGASHEWGGALGVHPTPPAGAFDKENNGAVYIFVRGGTGGWTQQAYVKPSFPTYAVQFGRTVALSADGSQLAVGAPYYTPPGGNISNSGFVETFARTGSAWSFQANLTPATVLNAQYFGSTVTLSGDGATLISSSYPDGALCVFTKVGDTWTQQPNITAPDALGGGVALSTDGTLLAVGALYAGPCGGTTDCAGRIYTFKLTAGTWSPETSFQATSATAARGLGGLIGMSGDGSKIAAGGLNLGKVVMFAHTGSAWTQEATLPASNTAGPIGGIAFSADGTRLALGARTEQSCSRGYGGDPTDTGCYDAGAVYELTRTGSAWSEVYIKAPNTDAKDRFGNTVALSADGVTLAVGAYQEQSRATGVNGDQSDNTGSEIGAVFVLE